VKLLPDIISANSKLSGVTGHGTEGRAQPMGFGRFPDVQL
jgi:hypothetical protein